MVHDGRVALVTGAGRGMGRAAALALADAGARVMAVSRTADELSAPIRGVWAPRITRCPVQPVSSSTSTAPGPTAVRPGTWEAPK